MMEYYMILLYVAGTAAAIYFVAYAIFMLKLMWEFVFD